MLFADCYVEIPGRLFTQLESPFDFLLTCIFFIPFVHNVKPLLFQLNPAGTSALRCLFPFLLPGRKKAKQENFQFEGFSLVSATL